MMKAHLRLLDDGEFTDRVIQLLAAAGVHAGTEVLESAIPRIVTPPSRAGTLRQLKSSTFAPSHLPPDTPILLQVLLANLQRNGATGIGLPACPQCHQHRVLRRRNSNGDRVCHRCAERRHYGECPICQRMKKLTATTDKGRVCGRCSPNGINLVTCDRCGKDVAATVVMNGQRLCLNCYPRKLRTCAGCGQEKKIASRILGSPHCFTCHNRVLRNPKPCPQCRDNRILAFLNADSIAVCAGCAGQPARYACRRCGDEEHQYGRLCGRCTLDDRLHEVLTGSDGRITEPLRRLQVYLLQQPRPAQIVKWLHRGPHVGLLRAIALGNKPLEEGSFADPNGGKGLLYLRSLLADSGALPANGTELTRLRHWGEHEISPLPTSRRLILTQYFNWVLLPRAKRDQMTSDLLPSAANHVRVATRGIAGFLGWLDTEHNIDLCDLTQRQVDEYTSTRSTSRWLPRFLAWATHNNHSTNSVEAPNPVPSLPAVTLSEQQADAIVTHLITNTTITAGTRFALLLIAIYGIPATRVVGLERTQVVITGSQVALIMGDHRLSLPRPVANLAISHRAEIDRTPGRWLFPGRQPGKHVNVQILRRRLDAYNVTLAELQTAARYRLAAAIPAKILADTLDFNISTVQKYAHLSNGTWSDYPGLRATPQSAPEPD